MIIFENGDEKPSKDVRAHFLACGIKCKNSKVSQVTAQVHMLLKSFQNIKRKYFQTPCRTSCVRMVLKIQMQRLFDDFSKFSSKCLQKMLEHIFQLGGSNVTIKSVSGDGTSLHGFQKLAKHPQKVFSNKLSHQLRAKGFKNPDASSISSFLKMELKNLQKMLELIFQLVGSNAEIQKCPR